MGMDLKHFSIIAAFRAKDRGIGYENTIPWDKPHDLAFFRKETTKDCKEGVKNMIIMGRCTFESLNCKPLKHRINVVITSQVELWQTKEYVDTYFVSSLNKALELNFSNCTIRHRFVIGGEKLYFDAIQHPFCTELIISVICDSYIDSENNDILCDRFFPRIDYDIYNCRGNIDSEHGVMFIRYIRKSI